MLVSVSGLVLECFRPKPSRGEPPRRARGGTGSWLVMAITETTQSRSSKFATCGSGGPFRWGLDRPPTAVTRPVVSPALAVSMCVGIGWGSGDGSGRPGCRWIGVLCSCRWRSSGRADIWVVDGLWGVGLWS